MNSQTFRLVAKIIIPFATLLIAGCENENVLEMQTLDDCSIVTSGFVERPLILSGDTLLFEGYHSQLKGYYIEADPSLKGTALVSNIPTYSTLKVYRQNEPLKFFYIMVENLRANVTSSWAYQNNSNNVNVYGRLYTWQAAYNYRNNVVMRLPKYSATTGLPITTATYPVGGKLPSFDDIRDLLRVSSLGNLPSNRTSFWDSDAYNNFVFGLSEKWDVADAFHSLSGWRDNMQVVPGNQEFNDLNYRGRFWTNELAATSAHYPLEVRDDTQEWVAYINAGHADTYAFAVRYVFYPTFQ